MSSNKAENKFSLENIFDLQERLMAKNVKVWESRFLFVKECIDLILNTYIDETKVASFKNQILTFNTIFHSGVSASIVSTKLLLYGLPCDALAILRVGLESFICCDFMIEFNAFEELKQSLIIKQEDPADKVNDYNKKLRAKDGQCRIRTWGDLSNFGAHLTIKRLKLNSFELGNDKFPRVGQGMLDEKTAFNVSSYLIQISLYMVSLKKDLFEKICCREALPENFYQDHDRLKEKYKNFQLEAQETVKKWENEELQGHMTGGGDALN